MTGLKVVELKPRDRQWGVELNPLILDVPFLYPFQFIYEARHDRLNVLREFLIIDFLFS